MSAAVGSVGSGSANRAGGGRSAAERVVARGLPPLPHVTPPSLRWTYIPSALLANHFDVMWVVIQVGRADSKMTTDVYNQLHQRARRDHGRAFDGLTAAVRESRGSGR